MQRQRSTAVNIPTSVPTRPTPRAPGCTRRDVWNAVFCLILTVQTGALSIIAGFTVWQSDSIHIIKHILGGDPIVRLHYNRSSHWNAFPYDHCLHDLPWPFGPGTACEASGEDDHEYTEEEVREFVRNDRSAFLSRVVVVE